MTKNTIIPWCVLPVDPPVQIGQGFNGIATHKRWTFEKLIVDESYCLDFIVDERSPVYAAREGEANLVCVDYDFNYFPKSGESIDAKLFKQAIDQINFIRINHLDGTYTLYGHLQRGGSSVQVGQQVAAGELIGFSGNTGFSSSPHVHFGIYERINNQEIRTCPFRLLDYDGPLEDREVRPEVYVNNYRTIPWERIA